MTQELQALIKHLRQQLPANRLLLESEQCAVYACDALAVYSETPALVVLAESEAEVQTVVKAAARFQVPLVARGAGTGLSAGALPKRDGMLLVTSRMREILELDPTRRIARVQPGVVNARVSEAARVHGLYYAPDPSSHIACSVGGNVAENAGGVHCLKYGVTVNNVQSLRLVDARGEILCMGAHRGEQTGMDLLALVHGSEGCLGIVTEITLSLTPMPEKTRTLLAVYDKVRPACDAVSAIIRAGIIPAAMEMMDHFAIQAAEAFCQPGYGQGANAVLLIDLDGHPLEVAAELEQVRTLLALSGAARVQEAADETQRQRWWKGRKSAFPAIGRLSPDYYCIDGTVPRGRIGDVLEGIQALSDRYGLRVSNVFHAGDGNLHPLILFDASLPGELEKTERLAADILALCVDVGGTITGEHGVGREKYDQMALQFSDAEIGQFLRVKAALDPQQLFNPDKHVPTLARCREYRQLRARQAGEPAHE
ncbi:FAD-linked oxidase C-terminal domain-containing protein [Simiduia agarivorans]|uniref:Glycolate oxidase subunit GlcD n=1 Tax=Simiduia agarivorans (strain DSM 21679 / JCM 13881 / BCRC 17597 / SA1) TaxID=1117647 RepID=K4KXS1_SIMAS|nr:FAD-linked oxidase C-terminal domain-containing protein [Simiduia agarivorans]AFU98707.1 glycolate oxidase subunit GlcD [Simiduia agarivorans SA1 = DSM 21679]